MTPALYAAALALAAVTAPPGGAWAWAVGGALLADPPGALALFDQPAALAAADAHGSLGAARVRLFELDALARVRVAVAAGRGRTAFALGAESFGPPGFRLTRMALGAARQGQALSAGAAASGWRLTGDAASRHGASLDAGVIARLPGFSQRLRAAWAARSLLAGGDPTALADPDWTAELALDLGPARAHLVRTRDLGGARSGAGVSLVASGVRVGAGVVGPPAQWTIGVGLARGRGARAAFARVEHPDLGSSDAIEGGLAW